MAEASCRFVKHLNKHGERLPLAFTFRMDGTGFDGAASAEAAGLWDAVADAAVKEVARAVGAKPEDFDPFRKLAAEQLRSLRRKRDDHGDKNAPQ